MMTRQQIYDLDLQLKVLYFNDIHEMTSLDEKLILIEAMRELVLLCNPDKHSQLLKEMKPPMRKKEYAPQVLTCVSRYQTKLSQHAWEILSDFCDNICIEVLVCYIDYLNIKKKYNHAELPALMSPVLERVKPYINPELKAKFDTEIPNYLRKFDLLDMKDIYECILNRVNLMLDCYQSAHRIVRNSLAAGVKTIFMTSHIDNHTKMKPLPAPPSAQDGKTDLLDNPLQPLPALPKNPSFN